MFDAESAMLLQSFDRQGAGVKSIAWNHAVPGEFFTCSEKVAALKVWNVSKKAPVDSFKLGNSGIRFIGHLRDRESLMVAFNSGSVGVYSLLKKKLEFVSEPGHSETVFDIVLNPANKNMLATASYDGTIKI